MNHSLEQSLYFLFSIDARNTTVFSHWERSCRINVCGFIIAWLLFFYRTIDSKTLNNELTHYYMIIYIINLTAFYQINQSINVIVLFFIFNTPISAALSVCMLNKLINCWYLIQFNAREWRWITNIHSMIAYLVSSYQCISSCTNII